MKFLTILSRKFNTLHSHLSSLYIKLCLTNESSKLKQRHEERSHYFCMSSKEEATVLTPSYQQSGKTLAPSPHLPNTTCNRTRM